MIRRFLTGFVLFVICLTAWGAKAYPYPICVTQKDGTTLTILLNGDENYHYVTTTDGVLLAYKDKSYYIATIEDNGTLKPTHVLAHNAGMRTHEEIRQIGLQDRDKFYYPIATKPRRESIDDTYSTTTKLFPHTGTPKALVILADFVDKSFKHNDETTIEIFNQYLNATVRPSIDVDASLHKNYGSVKMYFSEMSKNQFVPHFDIGALVHLPDSMKVYGAGNENMNGLFKKACSLAKAQGVDFSQYDENNDGYVDLVYIIYAGYGESTGGDEETIWPNSGYLSQIITYDNKRVFRYGVHSELNFSPNTEAENGFTEPQINGIGLFCHVFSHCMGLPDFYPTNKNAQNAGNPAMEFWDLMDGGEYTNNGYRPTAYTAWEREYMGWMSIDTLTVDSIGKQIVLDNIDAGGKAYRILKDNESNSSEYVVIQNIQPYRWNFALGRLYGQGMLVTHVDFDPTAFSLSSIIGVNNDIGHSRMTIVPADNEYISSYHQGEGKKYTKVQYTESHKGDPYPGSSNVTQIDSIKVYTGTMNKSFVDIEETDGRVYFYYITKPLSTQEEYTIDEMDNEITSIDDAALLVTDDSYEVKLDSEGRREYYYFPVFNILNFYFTEQTDIDGLLLKVYSKKEMKLNITISLSESHQPETLNARRAESTTPLSNDYELNEGEWKTIQMPVNNVSDVLTLTKVEGNGNGFVLGEIQYYKETEGAVTNVRHVETSASGRLKRGIYSLDGRYMGNDQRRLSPGLYLVNGKKMVIKDSH